MVAAIEKDSDMELTDKLLHFDSLSEAEKITGKSYKEDSDTTWMGMALLQQNNKIKHEILESQDDVCWGCKIDNYIRILTDLGFVKISEESFNGTGWDDKDIVEEKCYVYWQPSKSILSWFESFNKTDLNTSHWYFAYKPNSVQLFYDVGIHCSGGWYTGLENPTEKPSLPESEWIYMGNWDAREGIRHQMKKLDTYGSFITKWPKVQLLQLVNYIEWKQCKCPNYDYADEVTKRRFNSLPDYVKESIGGSCGRD